MYLSSGTPGNTDLRRWGLRILLAALLVSAGAASLPPSAFEPGVAEAAGLSQTEPARQLLPGQTVKGMLQGGEINAYAIQLPAGRFMQIRVEQEVKPIKVELLGADGSVLAKADEMALLKGSWRISWLGERDAAYRLEVSRRVWTWLRPAEQSPYTLHFLEFRPSQAADIEIVAGERALQEGRYPEAVNHFRAAGDRQGLAESLQQLSDQSQPELALEQNLEALALRSTLGDQRGEVIALRAVASCYEATGDWRKALDYAYRALVAARTLGQPHPEARVLQLLGQFYSRYGDQEMALEYYNRGVERLQDPQYGPQQAMLLAAIGNLEIELGNTDRAAQAVGRAVDIYHSVGNTNMEAYSHVSMAGACVSSGQFAQAMDHLDRAMELYVADKHRGGQVRTWIGVGKVRLAQKDAAAARDVFLRAVQLSNDLIQKGEGGAEQALPAHTGMAEALLLAGDRQGALDYFRMALEISRAQRQWLEEAEILRRMAEIESARGNLAQAQGDIENALKIIESFRGRIAGLASRGVFTTSKRPFYESYLDILMQSHAADPSRRLDIVALESSERARLKSFVDMLAEARLDIREGIDPALLERERALVQQIDAKGQSLLSAAVSRGRAASAEAIEKEFEALLKKYQGLESEIRAQSPRYAELSRPQPISFAEIQKLLDADTLLLEYWLGERAGYLWVVGRNAVASHVLPGRARVEEEARRFYELLTARQPVSGETAAQRQARVRQADAALGSSTSALSRMLLGPVMPQLGTRRLLIVADGALHYVPFAALQAAGPSCPAAGADCLLIHDHEIAYLPSVSVLASLRGRQAGQEKADKAAAVFADPVFEREDPRVRARRAASVAKVSSHTQGAGKEAAPAERSFERTLRDVGMGNGLPRLMASRQEAQVIRAADPSHSSLVALDFDASRASVLEASLKDYGILHFATHGVINNKHPELSGLVLSLVDPEGTPQAGFLGLNEVYNLRLDARLVVLSACNTALGKSVSGEGLVGLTRGFMYAGARRVAASLWKVDDEAAAEEMARFYRSLLGKGMTAAAALRAAQLQMLQLRRWQSPYYWAAFVLQGDW